MKALITVALLAGVAHADAPGATALVDQPSAISPTNPFELHVNGGVEITGGEGMIAGGFRGRVGVGRSFGTGTMRPQLVLGTVFGSGSISVADPRGLDGTLALGYRSFGSEAQVGLRFVNGGRVDSRIYASLAVMRVSLDQRLMFDTVAGISGSGSVGVRGALGANWADHCIFLPQQAELVYERDAGSARYGAMIGWGI